MFKIGEVVEMSVDYLIGSESYLIKDFLVDNPVKQHDGVAVTKKGKNGIVTVKYPSNGRLAYEVEFENVDGYVVRVGFFEKHLKKTDGSKIKFLCRPSYK